MDLLLKLVHRMGHSCDEVKFFKNGKPRSDGQYASWYSGEPGTGRWDQEDDILNESS